MKSNHNCTGISDLPDTHSYKIHEVIYLMVTEVCYILFKYTKGHYLETKIGGTTILVHDKLSCSKTHSDKVA